jgi:hypothetical protein
MAFEWHPPIVDPNTGFMTVCGIACRSGIQPYTTDDGSIKGVYRSADFIKSMADKFAEGKSALILQHTEFNSQNLSAQIGWINDGAFVSKDSEGFAFFEAVITDPNTLDEIKKQGDSLNLPVSPSYKHQLRKPSKPQYWQDSLGLVGAPKEEYVYVEEQIGDPTIDNLAVVDYGRGGPYVGIFYSNPLVSGIYNNDNIAPTSTDGATVEPSADSTQLYPYPHTENDDMKEVLDALAPMSEKIQKQCDAIDKMCDAMTKMADGMSGVNKMCDSLDRLESQISGLAGDIKSSRETQALPAATQLAAQGTMQSAVAAGAYTAGNDAAPAQENAEAQAADNSAPASATQDNKSQDALVSALDKMTSLVEKLAERGMVAEDASYVPPYVRQAQSKNVVTKAAGGGFTVAI